MTTYTYAAKQVGPVIYGLALGYKLMLTGTATVEITADVEGAQNGIAAWTPVTFQGGVARVSCKEAAVRVTATSAATLSVEQGSEVDLVASLYSGALTVAGSGVTATTNPDTGGIELSAGGDAIPMGQQHNTGSHIDFLDLRASSQKILVGFTSPYAAGGDATLDAMTSDQRSWMVHPCIIHIPEGFAGYPYWACVTPYPNGVSNYENPCIFRSYDSVTWEVPTGLTNPIVGKPADGYNADNYIFTSPDKKTLYMAYRERPTSGANTNTVRVMSSTDGVTWTSPVTIISGARGTLDFAAMSIMWNAAASRWEMISHNLDGGTKPVEFRTSANLFSGWSAATTLTITNSRGQYWWHSDWRLTENGYVGLLQDGSSGGGALYLAQSSDGVRFGVIRITSDVGYYKSGWSLLPGLAGIKMWVGMIMPVFRIYSQTYLSGRLAGLKANVAQEFAIGASSTRLKVKDTFTRADSASSVGSPGIGPAYTVDSGTWGISSNQLYPVGGAGKLFVESGSICTEVSAKINTLGSEQYILTNVADSSNFIRVGTAKVQVIVGGGVATQWDRPAFTAGDTVTVRKYGPRLTVLVNDIVSFDESITDLAMATKVGLQGNGCYFDNFTVIDIG